MTQENFGEARLHLVRSTGFTLEADIGIPQKGIYRAFRSVRVREDHIAALRGRLGARTGFGAHWQ